MKCFSRRGVLAAALAATAAVAPTLAMAATITEYLVPTPASLPRGIAVGSDGNLWFTEFGGNKIGRITTAGVITEFLIPTPGSQPVGITAGPDGNLWFAESGGNKIGKITTAGVFTEYTVPTAGSLPRSIVSGPDGRLWFTEGNADKIGAMTVAGSFTEYPIPGAAGAAVRGLAVGPDGNLWFTEDAGNRIGKVTTSGTFTMYTVPTPGSNPLDITAGPDGNLWFAEAAGNKIAKVTTTGTFTEFTIPTAGSIPRGIGVGPDGNLWFGEVGANKLGMVTTAGVFTEYPIPTAPGNPYQVVDGPDRNLWFTEYDGNKIGVLTDPSFPVCGNSLTEFGEDCDDSNIANGDCCSSTCQYDALDTACTTDGNVCTDDLCDATGTCEHTNNAVGCDDSDACTLTDACQAGECVGADDVVCEASDQCHLAGTCNTMTGLCSNPAKSDGVACDDGQYCTVNDVCDLGLCLAGPARDCSDSTACTADACDETGNTCTYAATPRNPTTCLVAPSTKLTIKDSATAGKDKLSWGWGKGDAFVQTDLGTPNLAMGTSYTLCIYDNTAAVSSLKVSLDIAPSLTLWTSKDPKGLQYKDKEGTSAGVTKALLKAGDATKTKVKFSAGGLNLVLPPAASGSTFFNPPNVVVQLVNSVGECWTSQFTPEDTKLNDVDSFKALTK